MTNPLKMTLLSATLVALLLPAAAQTSNPTPPTGSAPTSTAPSQPAPPVQPAPAPQTKPGETIAQHKENQQNRIANGIANGKLTAGEAGTLEKQESNLNHEETDMRKMDDGKLTSADRTALRQQQNQMSNEIYQDKHNAAAQKQDPTSQAGKRAENQQDRIAQGVRSGQLTAGESSNLEKQESNINKEVAQDRNANGGHMTAQERAQVNAQQNKVSKQIYKDKHNVRRQAK
jgi:hypothetical protein